MRMTCSPFISAFSVQPTPQYAHVVETARSGLPSSSTVFSVSAVVGQASTHAPHDTHSESMNGCDWLAETFDSKPRPSIVSANVPWISSHARTQREHTMQASWLKTK